jgi:hypothetical protein
MAASFGPDIHAHWLAISFTLSSGVSTAFAEVFLLHLPSPSCPREQKKCLSDLHKRVQCPISRKLFSQAEWSKKNR